MKWISKDWSDHALVRECASEWLRDEVGLVVHSSREIEVKEEYPAGVERMSFVSPLEVWKKTMR